MTLGRCPLSIFCPRGTPPIPGTVQTLNAFVCRSTLLKNPKIVILDEATSALDTHTEHQIQVRRQPDKLYRGTSLIRNSPPTRAAIGP